MSSHGRATATGIDTTCEWIEPVNMTLFLGEPGFISTFTQGEDYEGIAISASWKLQPRRIVELPADSNHAGFAAEVLAGLGLTVDHPLISQILSVDLDGDGVLEKLVVAQDAEITFDPVPQAYSVMFLRRLVDGVVETSIVAENVVLPGTDGFGDHRAVTGVADLNGDGRMEVVVSDHGWENSGIAVYELQGDRLEPVLGSSCGV